MGDGRSTAGRLPRHGGPDSVSRFSPEGAATKGKEEIHPHPALPVDGEGSEAIPVEREGEEAACKGKRERVGSLGKTIPKNRLDIKGNNGAAAPAARTPSYRTIPSP